ncbi:MAG: polysulfide reductase NrfD [Candidatus Sulfobium sp.]
MFEKALVGSKRYWTWIGVLLVIIGVGVVNYLHQFSYGLGLTGMSRDVSWGFYIAQFTFLVGVAASAVMLVIPYYLHHYKTFRRIVILGEFLAIASVVMCILFIFVDLGQPMRVMNVALHPRPNSVMFWDMVVLLGYLALNVVIGWTTLGAERKEVRPPAWVKPLILLSVPWAVSIHTVTAFLYAGLPARHLWLSAIMAARFLSGAFAAGPALLILLAFIVRRVSSFDAGREAIEAVAKIVAYAMSVNVFFILLEFFTAFYSGVPMHSASLRYLFFGLDGHYEFVPFMWVLAILAVVSLVLLVIPQLRNNHTLLPVALVAVFISTWIDKGVGLVVGGFIPNPFETITTYSPTAPELLITLGVYAAGALTLTVLYKIAIGVKEEVGT